MKHEDFDKCVETRMALCKKVLVYKGTEYSDGDRLSNFKKAAGLIGDTPESALWGMAVKHIVSINDMIQDLSVGIAAPMCAWEEKIGDALNYLLILRAQLEERKRS
jgi:hypothetical protein